MPNINTKSQYDKMQVDSSEEPSVNNFYKIDDS